MGTRRRTAADAAALRSGTPASAADAELSSTRLTEGLPVDVKTSEVRLPTPDTASGDRHPTAPSLWSRVQAIIGFVTGVLSIVGALYSAVSYLTAPKQGELVALVRESRTDRPLTDATVEVLTPEDALVTTLAPSADGRTRHSLHAGTYRVRVTRPGFGSDTKPIQILPGRSVEIRFQLAPQRGGPFADDGRRGGAGPVSRFLGRLGL